MLLTNFSITDLKAFPASETYGLLEEKSFEVRSLRIRGVPSEISRSEMGADVPTKLHTFNLALVIL